MIFLGWCNVLRWIWCLWCYSECKSTPGKLEKYGWQRWESKVRFLPFSCIFFKLARCGYTLRVTSQEWNKSFSQLPVWYYRASASDVFDWRKILGTLPAVIACLDVYKNTCTSWRRTITHSSAEHVNTASARFTPNFISRFCALYMLFVIIMWRRLCPEIFCQQFWEKK
jgi:hypothetical protein